MHGDAEGGDRVVTMGCVAFVVDKTPQCLAGILEALAEEKESEPSSVGAMVELEAGLGEDAEMGAEGGTAGQVAVERVAGQMEGAVAARGAGLVEERSSPDPEGNLLTSLPAH